MPIKVKADGGYADTVAVLAKVGGAYAPVGDVFVKESGSYRSVEADVWPPVADGEQAAVALDFINDRYWWDGQAHTYDELVATGSPTRGTDGLATGEDGYLQIPWSGWHNPEEMTIFADVRRDWPNEGTGCVFSFGNVGAAARAEFDMLAGSTGRTLLFDAGFVVQSYGQGAQFARFGSSFKNGGSIFGEVSAAPPANLGTGFTVGLGSGGDIGRRKFDGSDYFGATDNGRIRSVVLFNRQISDSAFDSLMLQTNFTNLHLLGDSFINSYDDSGVGASRAIRLLMTDGQRALSMDGVGGSSLAEQAVRYAASEDEVKSRTLVIMDGGVNGDAAANLAALQSIVSNCTSGRWLYVQPSPENFIQGSDARATWDGIQSTLLSWITSTKGANRYVECLTALKAANDGSDQDLADVANNIVPTSLRLPGDAIHENNAGAFVRWSQIWNRIKFLGW